MIIHELPTSSFETKIFFSPRVNICVHKCTAEQEWFLDYLIPIFLNYLLQNNPALVRLDDLTVSFNS